MVRVLVVVGVMVVVVSTYSNSFVCLLSVKLTFIIIADL